MTSWDKAREWIVAIGTVFSAIATVAAVYFAYKTTNMALEESRELRITKLAHFDVDPRIKFIKSPDSFALGVQFKNIGAHTANNLAATLFLIERTKDYPVYGSFTMSIANEIPSNKFKEGFIKPMPGKIKLPRIYLALELAYEDSVTKQVLEQWNFWRWDGGAKGYISEEFIEIEADDLPLIKKS